MSFNTTSDRDVKNSRKGTPLSLAPLAANPNAAQVKITPIKTKVKWDYINNLTSY